ncbi:hypothetical protein Nepgr_017863 [Nepenthes gracilis]|uniref:Uncharacterized protein n=1 Tax=Nepenthes gracilis TaxID=150966 RepID=A0AAD3ST33_NEPGR|nr:hypothetical protein Nepgr_017863 [Nepenthes gracilis]
MGQIAHSCSKPSSKFLNDQSSTSTSPMSLSATSVSSNTERTEECSPTKPRYMNPTASNKAKQQRGSKQQSSSYCTSLQKDLLFLDKSAAMWLSKEARIIVDSCQDLYPPIRLDRYHQINCR